jgi:hypothetical protein
LIGERRVFLLSESDGSGMGGSGFEEMMIEFEKEFGC